MSSGNYLRLLLNFYRGKLERKDIRLDPKTAIEYGI
jgi:hypothetical protein